MEKGSDLNIEKLEKGPLQRFKNQNLLLKKFGEIEGGGGVADPAAITHENHTRNFKAFLDALESGEDFWIDGREARKAVEVILAIYKSAKEQKPVSLS